MPAESVTIINTPEERGASMAAAIVGAAEAKEIGYPETPKTSLQLHIEAIKNVSDQTGIPISQIDGVFGAGRAPWPPPELHRHDGGRRLLL